MSTRLAAYGRRRSPLPSLILTAIFLLIVSCHAQQLSDDQLAQVKARLAQGATHRCVLHHVAAAWRP